MFPTARLQDLVIEGPAELGEHPALVRAVLRGIRAAQDAGAISKDRSDPEGDEWVLWAGPLAAPLGFAIFYDVGRGRMWLDILYVEPVARRSGLATRLVQSVAETSRAHGADRLLLGTLVTNADAQAFIARLGFAASAINYAMEL